MEHAKNLTLYAPEKKGIISGVIGFWIMILSVIFVLIGEKTINFKGITLQEDEDFYPPNIAKKIYLYFLMGKSCIPIGLLFALLLIYEYKKEDNQENNSNSISDSEKKEDEQKLKNNEENKEEKDNEIKKEKIEEVNKENEKEQKNLKKENTKKKIKQVVKTFRYCGIALISFFINISISFMVNTGRAFGALIGINGQVLQFAGAIQVLFILILSPLLGILVDKKRPLLLLRILEIESIIPGLFLTFFMSYTVVFIACFALYVLTLVTLSVSFGPFIMEVFGIHESVTLGEIINGFSKFSDLIAAASAFGFSLDCDKTEKEKDCLKSWYAVLYLVSAVYCGISSILLFFENRNKFQYENENVKEEPFLKNNNDNDGLMIVPDEVPIIEN